MPSAGCAGGGRRPWPARPRDGRRGSARTVGAPAERWSLPLRSVRSLAPGAAGGARRRRLLRRRAAPPPGARRAPRGRARSRCRPDDHVGGRVAPPSRRRGSVAITASTGVYLLALAAWLGGLVALAALLVPRHRPSGLEQVWSRFSWFAGLSVLGLAVTGSAQHLLVGGTATSRSGLLLLIEGLVLAATLLLSRYAVAHGRRMAFRERYLRGFAVEQRGPRPMLGRAIGVQLVLAVVLVGVAVAQLAVLPVPGRPGCRRSVRSCRRSRLATAQEGRPADSDTTRFVPERIDLPGGAYAAVVPVATVGRELVVPEDPGKVGWWDGSSYVGDDYGSTVIAGHVDSFDRGIGFFFRLWNIKVGERVVLSAGNARQAYTHHHAAPGPPHRPGRRRGGVRHPRTAPAGADHLRRRVPAGPWRVQQEPDRHRPTGLVSTPGHHPSVSHAAWKPALSTGCNLGSAQGSRAQCDPPQSRAPP